MSLSFDFTPVVSLGTEIIKIVFALPLVAGGMSVIFAIGSWIKKKK